MKIFKKIGLIALAICLGIGSLFITMPQKSNRYASADTTSSENIVFNSSNIITSRVANRLYSSSGSASTNFSDYLFNNSYSNAHTNRWYLNFSFKLIFAPLGSAFNIYPYVSGYLNNVIGIVDSIDDDPAGFTSLAYNSTQAYMRASRENEDFYISSYTASRAYRVQDDYSFRTLIGFACVAPSFDDNPSSLNPSLEIVTIEISNFVDFCNISFDLTPYFSGTNMNVVCYTDSIGYKFIFLIPTWVAFDRNSADNFSNYFDYRKYYTANAFDFSNSGYYQQGLTDGYASGYSTGLDNGYAEGSTDGYQQGFQAGRVDGIESASQYTFLGLIGAVVDAPVSVFKTMFNFNLLGVNMRDFLLALLTFSFILVAVKFIFMRK